jgi:hypothetical protein
VTEWLGRGATGEVFAVTDPDGVVAAACKKWRAAAASGAAVATSDAKAAPAKRADGAAGDADDTNGAGDAARAAAATAVAGTTRRSTRVKSSESVIQRATRLAARLKGSPDRPKPKSRARVPESASGAGSPAAAAAALSAIAPSDDARTWCGVAKWFRRLDSAEELQRAFDCEVNAYSVLNAARCPGVLYCVASVFPYLLLDGVGDKVTKLVHDDIEPLLNIMEAMHTAGVLHMDLRLSNFVRCRGRITVIDFTCSVCAVRWPEASPRCIHARSRPFTPFPSPVHVLRLGVAVCGFRWWARVSRATAVARRQVLRTRNTKRASTASSLCQRPRTI